MILEIATLDVIPGQEKEFEVAFAQAEPIIMAKPGFISHKILRCMEHPHRYVLLVEWEKLEDHTVGFRGSAEYQTWKKMLHHFYNPFPTVEHYQAKEAFPK